MSTTETTDTIEHPEVASTVDAFLAAERRQFLIRSAVVVGLVALVVMLPFVNEPTEVLQLVEVGFFAIAALSIVLLTGFTGQISLGQGAFMGVGAYTTAILVEDHRFSWLLATLVAMALAFIVGALVGLPALRISGPALALATLGLAVLFPQLVRRFDSVTGGSGGMRVSEDFDAPEWTGLADDQWLYFVVFASLGILLLLARNLMRSRPGRSLVAIRDNETAAATLGVDVAVTKVVMFGLSAMIAGLAGSFMVYRTGQVSAGSFDILLSIRVLVMAVVGGVAMIAGPLLGSAGVFYLDDQISERVRDGAFDSLPEWMANGAEQLTPVLLGVALIVLMLVMPDGIAGGLSRGWRRLRSRASPAPAGLSSRPDENELPVSGDLPDDADPDPPSPKS